MDNLLRRHYPKGDLDRLATRIGVSRSAIRNRAQVLKLRRKVNIKRTWTERRLKILQKYYACMPMGWLCVKTKHSESSIYGMARQLGLKKSKLFISEMARERCDHPNKVATRFKAGHVPANKGKRLSEFMSAEGIERSKAGRFRPGTLPHNTKPVGYERIGKDGYVYVKVEDGKAMVPKHRHVWKLHHGPVPDGMLVCFIDGDRQNCDISNLELRSMADNARRIVSSETPETRAKRVAKGQQKRNEAIRRDRIRIMLGEEPLTGFVKYGTKVEADMAIKQRQREYRKRKKGVAGVPEQDVGQKSIIVIPDWDQIEVHRHKYSKR
jgi:hypothetical protein